MQGENIGDLCLESQEQQLKEYGAIKIYKDSFTGTKLDRPQLNRLLEKLQELVVLLNKFYLKIKPWK